MAMKKENLPVLTPQIIEHEQFGQIRFVKIDWESWFVAADVCKVLDIQNVRQNLANFPDDEKGVCNIYTLGGPQKVNIVNEPGLYRLIFMSRKPEAEKIKRWTFHDVLPSIRKRGFYVAPHQKVIRINGREKFKAFKAKYPEGAVEIKAQYDCGDIYDVVVHSDKLIADREVKKLV